ncbi:hypothetical protein [Microbacterium album]|uniref:Uncharacterized protein n=1 Tax=Microbacterium album TaxID=2053191 RepID=A0A917ICP8_9MICO|nr:hypothetical protein [Microbacterium album]GGH34089.1 hypothetical protein GCM10010921_01520 [Microbacterium album]
MTDIEQPYTPSLDEVREAHGWTGHDSHVESNRAAKRAEFDRWLAAHNEAVRAEALREAGRDIDRMIAIARDDEREKAAQIAETHPAPLGAVARLIRDAIAARIRAQGKEQGA